MTNACQHVTVQRMPQCCWRTVIDVRAQPANENLPSLLRMRQRAFQVDLHQQAVSLILKTMRKEGTSEKAGNALVHI